MKKTILMFGAVAVMTLASCKNEEKEIVTDSSTTDTIVVKNETDVPPPPPPPVVEEDPDGTSINVSGDGINVDSKDGDKKTTVKVSEDGGTVNIKK